MTDYITSGCFDILHDGHYQFFNDVVLIMGDEDDKLIIYLNSDDSIKKLKGDKRPVNTYNKRKENLENLFSDWDIAYMLAPIEELCDTDCVNKLKTRRCYLYVTSQEKINIITPEIKYCIDNKRSILYIPYLDGHSTTKIIESGDNKWTI